MNRVRGPAADLHARDLPAATSVWHFEVDRPAVVLGSRQSTDVLDLDACDRAGVDVASRRSGGGIVLVVPGETVWIDVVVAATDQRWDPDVRRSMIAMGERWVEALAGTVEGDLTVHRGPMLRTSWSELVCFAGIGPGEVLLEGRKLVGLSQRRTRHASRFQCAVNRRHEPDALLALLAGHTLAGLPGNGLPPVATLPAADAAVLAARLLAAL